MTLKLMAAGLAVVLAGLGQIGLAGAKTIAPAELPAPSQAKVSSQGGSTTNPTAIMKQKLSVVRVQGTQVVHQITGEDSLNATGEQWDVYGTDLGHMFFHRDKLHMVFGDTFGPKGIVGRFNWRSNVMATIADPDPANGFKFDKMITGPDGRAKELIGSRKIGGIEKTVIPTQGISIGGRMYLHYMSVKSWADEGGVWTVNHSGFAYSDNDGQDWHKPADAVWSKAIGFEQVAFARRDGVLYTFGIPEGRYGGVRLRRVEPEKIMVQGAYQYWDGSQWVAEAAAAAEIVPGPVGELSVAWSETHGRWLMMYLDQQRRAVMLRTAPDLTGPWGQAQVVATHGDYPRLYAPYIVPGVEIDGDLYFTMSRWDPYNVYLMHTKLEWTPPIASVESEVPVLPTEVAIPVSKSN